MSYDLILWRGRPTEAPGKVWRSLYRKEGVRFVMPLRFEAVRDAFRSVYGEDLEIDETSKRIMGRGFELSVPDGAYYVHTCCSWALPEAEGAIVQLRRAAAAAGCSTYDPQADELYEAPAFVDNPVESAPAPSRPDLIVPPFAVGETVVHTKFGRGMVVSIDGRGDNAKVKVRFPNEARVLIARVLSKA